MGRAGPDDGIGSEHADAPVCHVHRSASASSGATLAAEDLLGQCVQIASFGDHVAVRSVLLSALISPSSASKHVLTARPNVEKGMIAFPKNKWASAA